MFQKKSSTKFSMLVFIFEKLTKLVFAKDLFWLKCLVNAHDLDHDLQYFMYQWTVGCQLFRKVNLMVLGGLEKGFNGSVSLLWKIPKWSFCKLVFLVISWKRTSVSRQFKDAIGRQRFYHNFDQGKIQSAVVTFVAFWGTENNWRQSSEPMSLSKC